MLTLLWVYTQIRNKVIALSGLSSQKTELSTMYNSGELEATKILVRRVGCNQDLQRRLLEVSQEHRLPVAPTHEQRVENESGPESD